DVEEHEHRDQDRSYERIHSRARGQHQVEAADEEHGDDEDDDRGRTEAVEQTSPFDRDNLADVRPFEVGQELRGGEEQHHDRHEGRNAGSHELGNVTELPDGTGDDAVDDADGGEEQHHDDGDVVHQRRVEDASALSTQR